MTTFKLGIVTSPINPAGGGPPGSAAWGQRLFGRAPRKTLLRILILVVGSFLTFKLVLMPIRVTGISMEPTCHDGQVRLLNLLAYARQEPQRGDIVGIRFGPRDPIMIKRVIGRPGDRIAFYSGVLFINGVQIMEPYLSSPGAWEWPEETLTQDTYYVAGDNRPISQQFKVDRKQIFGKLFGSAY